MLPFHKCCRIYEIKGSVICEIRVKGFIKFARRALGSKGNLGSRIRGWIQAVNQGSYDLCLKYVAPPEFTGGKIGLTRTIRGGEELLLFCGGELLPFSDYRIKKVEFHNNGYEAKATIDARVI